MTASFTPQITFRVYNECLFCGKDIYRDAPNPLWYAREPERNWLDYECHVRNGALHITGRIFRMNPYNEIDKVLSELTETDEGTYLSAVAIERARDRLYFILEETIMDTKDGEYPDDEDDELDDALEHLFNHEDIDLDDPGEFVE